MSAYSRSFTFYIVSLLASAQQQEETATASRLWQRKGTESCDEGPGWEV